MSEVFDIIGQVGAPIAAAMFMGGFIFLIIRKIMDDVVGDTEEVKGISKMLITRIKVMNNDMIKIDMSVSSALGLAPDLDKIARAENFVESGSIDARRDRCNTTIWITSCCHGRTWLFRILRMDYGY